MKLRTFFKAASICLILAFVSCQQDDTTLSPSEKDVNSNNGIMQRDISLKDLDAFPKAKEIVDKIKNSKIKNSDNSKSVYNAQYDFYVNTDHIKLIQNGVYHSLTFPIFRFQDDQTFTENLVLSLEDDGNYSVAIYKYRLTPENKEDILNDRETQITSPVTRTVLTGFNPDDVVSRMVTVWYTEIIVIGCSANNTHGAHNFGAWSECIASVKPQYMVITRMVGVEVPDDDNLMDGADISAGGGGGGGSVYNPTAPPFDPNRDFDLVGGHITKPVVLETKEVKFWNRLDSEQKFTMQQIDIRGPLLVFLNSNEESERNMAVAELILDYYSQTYDTEFCEWAFEYMTENPDVTAEQFENWFMGNPEGSDGDFDSNYWNNPNLNFPQQALPSWQNFNNAYPKNPNGTYMTGADNVFNFVGGAVLQARVNYPDKTNNPCALKVSIALNGSGVTIPELYYPNGNPMTLQGANGKYYFLNAASLNAWMKKTFPSGTANNPKYFHFTQGGTNGKQFESSIKGKKGIFTMLPTNPTSFGASGHCDKYDGTNCAAHCYFPHASEVNIWILD